MDARPTEVLTPDEWDALPKSEMWGGQFGDPGHCHNLLDEWADQIRGLESELAAARTIIELAAQLDINGQNPRLFVNDLARQAREFVGRPEDTK